MYVVVKVQRTFVKSVLYSITPYVDCITHRNNDNKYFKKWKFGDWEHRIEGLCKDKYEPKQKTK